MTPLTPERVAELRLLIAADPGWDAIALAVMSHDLLAAAEERDAYRKAKQENDERFMRERDQARAGRDALLADAEQIISYLPRHGNAVVPRFAVEDLAETVRRIREKEETDHV